MVKHHGITEIRNYIFSQSISCIIFINYYFIILFQATIDYLKFDIEYMEWNVLTNILKDNSVTRVKQLGFEIHLRYPEPQMSKELTISKSEFLKKYQILRLLEKYNFKKFNYRLNPFCMYKSKTTSKSHSFCYELHYLNFRFVEKKYLKSSNFH